MEILLAPGEYLTDEFPGGGTLQQRRHGAHFEHGSGSLFPQRQLEPERGEGFVKLLNALPFRRMQRIFERQHQGLGHARKAPGLYPGHQHPLVCGVLVEDQQGRVVAAVAYIPEQQIRPADLPHVHVRADAYLAFAKLLDFGLFGLGGSGAVGGWWLHGGVRRGFR